MSSFSKLHLFLSKNPFGGENADVCHLKQQAETGFHKYTLVSRGPRETGKRERWKHTRGKQGADCP